MINDYNYRKAHSSQSLGWSAFMSAVVVRKNINNNKLLQLLKGAFISIFPHIPLFFKIQSTAGLKLCWSLLIIGRDTQLCKSLFTVQKYIYPSVIHEWELWNLESAGEWRRGESKAEYHPLWSLEEVHGLSKAPPRGVGHSFACCVCWPPFRVYGTHPDWYTR